MTTSSTSGARLPRTSVAISKAQTHEVLCAIEQLLLSVGSDRTRVLSVRILLAHREDYEGLNRVWDEFSPKAMPPHALVPWPT